MAIEPSVIFRQLQPVFRMLGLDKKAQAFTKEKLMPRFQAAIPGVVARLEKDGVTPAKKDGSPEAEAHIVKFTMLLLAKGALKGVLPSWAIPYAADAIRDPSKAKIVTACAPQFDTTTSTQALVELVLREWERLVF